MGIVCRAGDSISSFWRSLLDGVSVAAPLTLIDTTDLSPAYGCEVTQFTGAPFLDVRDRRRLARVTQLATYAGMAAVADAGLERGAVDERRASVVCGCGIGGLEVWEEQAEIFRRDGLARVSPFTVPAIMPNAAAAHLSMKLGWQGQASCPALACASGAAAIADATWMIREGRADTVLAGGAEALLTPMVINAFSRTGAMNTGADDPSKASRPFDSARAGFVMGEGAAFVLLEDEELAKRRGAAIKGRVLGVAQNSDAFHITAPSADGTGAAACMQLALADADLSPSDVAHVNCHGTSTELNDAAEAAAIAAVFGAFAIPATAPKGVTGHMIGASAAAEAIAAIIAATERTVPPIANLTDPDESMQLDTVRETPRSIDGDIVVSNSFAFGGHNVALVLQGGESL
jgi:3-oxoacyl-[acyl-carrier-protein] synthase II